MRLQLLACTCALAALLAAPASAQTTPPAAGTTVRTIDNAKVSGTVTTTRDAVAGTFNRATDLTRKSDGATATGTVTGARSDTGVTVETSRTGFGGKTVSTDYARTRTETGFTETGTITRANGNELTLNGGLTRGDGTLNANRSLTNAQGDVVASRTQQVSRGANGQISRTTTANGPQRALGRIGRPIGVRQGRR